LQQNKLGRKPQLPSLELAMDLLETSGQCDNGYACVYQNNLSWSSPTPLFRRRLIRGSSFESLFGDGGTWPNAVLRSAKSEFARRVQRGYCEFATAAWPDGSRRVNQYLDTVREVERRIQKAEADARDNPLPDLDRPVGRAGCATRTMRG
jgi:hypothetical protein